MLANEPTKKFKKSPTYSNEESKNKSEYQSLIDEIDDLANLKSGWNGENAKVINKSSINFSKDFCSQLFQSNSIPLPIIDPHPDGNVSFTWRNEKGIINVACLPDKNITYAAYIPRSKAEYKNRGKLNNDTVQDIAKWIFKIVKR